MMRLLSVGKPAEDLGFAVGKNVATACGKVVFRNELIELIQYYPTTGKVHPEPILIVPAWIMKYYILDLSPHNSLVKFLTGQGFTVFMISWRNPGPGDRDIAFDDYRKLGVKAAVEAIGDIVPDRQIHALGYCLGGTLLSIAAATMARDGDIRLKSITMLAAQTDFTEAGELTLFINESQIAFLEDMMWEHGVLDTTQMSGAFQLLRPNDLIWSLSAATTCWRAGGTQRSDGLERRRHPPAVPHAFGISAQAVPQQRSGRRPLPRRGQADRAVGHPRADVRGRTVRDHVAPWKSAYKIHYQVEADVTFVLTSGGHNAGIVAPPAEEGHFYQVKNKPENAPYVGPDEWLKVAPRTEGSWWPEWTRWLTARSGEPCEPPRMGVGSADGESLPDAPGDYVHL